jgi:hypothetical protein
MELGQMPAIEVIEGDEVTRAAYWLARQEWMCVPGLSPEERASGPERLLAAIRKIVGDGATDVDSIAAAALGSLRQTDQVARSAARVQDPSETKTA